MKCYTISMRDLLCDGLQNCLRSTEMSLYQIAPTRNCARKIQSKAELSAAHDLHAGLINSVIVLAGLALPPRMIAFIALGPRGITLIWDWSRTALTSNLQSSPRKIAPWRDWYVPRGGPTQGLFFHVKNSS